MENASKALLIAGAILIVIILISVGLLVIQSTGTVQDRVKTDAETIAIRTFNSQFIYYERDGNSASTVKSLMNTIIASNGSNPNHEVKLYWDGDEEKEVMSNEISAENTYKISVAYNKDGYIHKAYLSTTRSPKPPQTPEPEPTPDKPEEVTARITKHTSTLSNNILFVVDVSESMGDILTAIKSMINNTISNIDIGNCEIKVALFSEEYVKYIGYGGSCNCTPTTTVKQTGIDDNGNPIFTTVTTHQSGCPVNSGHTETKIYPAYHIIDVKDSDYSAQLTNSYSDLREAKERRKTDFGCIKDAINEATGDAGEDWSVVIASDFYYASGYSQSGKPIVLLEGIKDTNIYKNNNLENVILVRVPTTFVDNQITCNKLIDNINDYFRGSNISNLQDVEFVKDVDYEEKTESIPTYGGPEAGTIYVPKKITKIKSTKTIENKLTEAFNKAKVTKETFTRESIDGNIILENVNISEDMPLKIQVSHRNRFMGSA